MQLRNLRAYNCTNTKVNREDILCHLTGKFLLQVTQGGHKLSDSVGVHLVNDTVARLFK